MVSTLSSHRGGTRLSFPDSWQRTLTPAGSGLVKWREVGREEEGVKLWNVFQGTDEKISQRLWVRPTTCNALKQMRPWRRWGQINWLEYHNDVAVRQNDIMQFISFRFHQWVPCFGCSNSKSRKGSQPILENCQRSDECFFFLFWSDISKYRVCQLASIGQQH